MDRNPHGNSWFRRGVPRFSSTLQNRFAAILAAPQFLVPCLLAVGVSLWFLHIADDSLAQIGGVFPTLRSGDKDEDAGNDAVQFPTDRDKNVALQRARDLVRKQQFSDGGLALDRILADPQDVFYKPDPKQPVYRSIKAEAQHILGNMSEEGLATYELQFGANSQRLLDEAIQSGSLFELGQVIRRYFHTAAGYQAALLLGRNHLDNGRPLAAALLFERLLQAPVAERKFEPGLSILLATSWQRAGAPEKAQKVLDALKKSKAGQTTQIAGKETAVLAPDGDSLEWLNKLVGKIEVATSMAVASNWTMASGNASRNALSNGASPLLNHRWRVKSAMTKAIQDELMRARKQSSDSGRAVVPALQPLAVDGVVIMRTPQGGMWGIDFASGKLEWEPGSNRSAIESPSNVGRESAYMQSLSQRTWENATFGTLSSAGDLVFSIDDSEDQTAKVAQYSGRPRMLFPGGGMGEMPQVTAGYNLLSARSLKNRQGALQWQVGGSAGNADPSKPESAQLAGAFFLGPPLPLQGQLYVLAEIKSGISLVVLDAKTGKVDWIQQLAFIDGTESQDPSRRLAGASPSFADGILVCPTAAGAVVAVDLSTRSLMWGFQFPLSAEQEMLRQQNMHRFGMGSPSTGPRSQWLDSTAVVANGKVYLTARESDQIHCLSLVDGKQVWSKKRDSGLYIGAVQGHRLLLVSEQQVQALNADSGRQIWSLSLGSSRPSGRGYFSDGNYFLPLSTAEVVKIDLAKGEITNRSKSRSGIVPGNLVCYEGHILSQGVESLDKFFQLEPLRAQVQLTLAKNPNDPEALAWRGEIALDEGNLSQAIADLRTAYSNPVAQDGDPVYLSRIEGERSRMRELLLDGLASAIEKDFAKSEPLLRELEQLVTLESERAGYLRLVGDGNQAAGNVVAALDAYMELADLKNQPGEIEFISLDWSVRRDRWIQARLESLWKSSAGPNRKAIDEKIALKLSQATGEDAVQGDVPDGTLQAKKALSATGSRIEPLRNFISRFSFHPSSEVARVMLLSMLGGAETLLEQEKLLHELSLSEDPARKREAIARLANFYESVGLANDSAKYYRRLETEFADVPCLEGKTGRELAASLAPKGDVRLAMGFSASNWPFGEVKSEQVRGVMTRKEYQRSSQQYRPVELRGLPGSFADSHLHLDQISSQASKLVCRDNLGREQFRLSVPEANLIYNYGFQQVPTYAYARGRLLIVNTGLHLHAVDTLRPPTKNIIWQKELIDPVQIQQMRFQGIETSRR
ncbi:MAG: PQQ-binding-like beta-propeller repeat protein, partial [Planctomycetota bacterium]|nr:PQQ-binding-like beta-propeller repeat protein [Planctomycetota bacterium]